MRIQKLKEHSIPYHQYSQPFFQTERHKNSFFNSSDLEGYFFRPLEIVLKSGPSEENCHLVYEAVKSLCRAADRICEIVLKGRPNKDSIKKCLKAKEACRKNCKKVVEACKKYKIPIPKACKKRPPLVA